MHRVTDRELSVVDVSLKSPIEFIATPVPSTAARARLWTGVGAFAPRICAIVRGWLEVGRDGRRPRYDDARLLLTPGRPGKAAASSDRRMGPVAGRATSSLVGRAIGIGRKLDALNRSASAVLAFKYE